MTKFTKEDFKYLNHTYNRQFSVGYDYKETMRLMDKYAYRVVVSTVYYNKKDDNYEITFKQVGEGFYLGAYDGYFPIDKSDFLDKYSKQTLLDNIFVTKGINSKIRIKYD